jgi:putative glutamine amidotransferase
MLAQDFGKQEMIVHSVHFQGVGRLAEGLDIEARAPDGLVEAFSTKIGAAPVIAVQWHPEWNTQANPDSQAFFRLLGRVLRGES